MTYLIIGVDPGKTTGVCILGAEQLPSSSIKVQVRVLDAFERKFKSVVDYGKWLRSEITSGRCADTRVVAIEDYRVYPTKQGINVGRELAEAQMIGVTRYIAARNSYSGWGCSVIPAVSKGRWPESRIKARLDIEGISVEGNHAEDAFLIALLALEQKGGIKCLR